MIPTSCPTHHEASRHCRSLQFEVGAHCTIVQLRWSLPDFGRSKDIVFNGQKGFSPIFNQKNGRVTIQRYRNFHSSTKIWGDLSTRMGSLSNQHRIWREKIGLQHANNNHEDKDHWNEELNWLVVDLPLWKILVSWDDDIPNTVYGKS